MSGLSRGRIAAIGSSGRRQGGGDFRGQGPACAARRDRQPGAFPRARQRAQGRPGDRQPRRHPGRRHRRVRNAQHQSAHHHAAPRSRTSSPAPRAACIATMLSMSGATPANIGALAALERMPGVCGVKAFLGSSTGTLLLSKPDDILAALKAGKPPRRGAFRRRRPADRAQAFRRARQARHPSGLARCRNRARLHRTGAGAGERGRPAPACAACHHRR